MEWLRNKYEEIRFRWSVNDIELDEERGQLRYTFNGWAETTVVLWIKELEFQDTLLDDLGAELQNQIELTYDPEFDGNAEKLLKMWSERHE